MVLFFYLFLIMVLCHFCCVCYFGKGAEKGVAGKNCWMGAAKFSVFSFSGKAVTQWNGVLPPDTALPRK